jgi:hypothetical protein
MPSRPVAMSANEAGSGVADTLLASAAFGDDPEPDDPEPSDPDGLPDGEPPTSSPTGVASSRNALPPGDADATSVTGVAEMAPDGTGGVVFAGAGGFGEDDAGDLGARACLAAVSRAPAVLSARSERAERFIIFHRLPSEADGLELEDACAAGRWLEWLPQGAHDAFPFPPSCALPRDDVSASATSGAATSAPLLLWAVVSAPEGNLTPPEVPGTSMPDSWTAAESERSGVGQKHMLAGVQLVSFIAAATPDTSRTATTMTTRRTIPSRMDTWSTPRRQRVAGMLPNTRGLSSERKSMLLKDIGGQPVSRRARGPGRTTEMLFSRMEVAVTFSPEW